MLPLLSATVNNNLPWWKEYFTIILIPNGDILTPLMENHKAYSVDPRTIVWGKRWTLGP